MKSVMLSIQPKWCELIASGKKTIEVRKSKIPVGSKVYIYQTKKNWIFKLLPWLADRRGKVIGEFVCDRIDFFDSAFDEWANASAPSDVPCVIDSMGWEKFLETIHKKAYITDEELNDYFPEEVKAYLWHISDLKIYDKPKKIYDFYRFGAATPEELDDGLCCYCRRTNYGELATIGTPNGATFCEGRFCDDAYKEYLDQNFILEKAPQSWCYVEELEV